MMGLLLLATLGRRVNGQFLPRRPGPIWSMSHDCVHRAKPQTSCRISVGKSDPNASLEATSRCKRSSTVRGVRNSIESIDASPAILGGVCSNATRCDRPLPWPPWETTSHAHSILRADLLAHARCRSTSLRRDDGQTAGCHRMDRTMARRWPLKAIGSGVRP